MGKVVENIYDSVGGAVSDILGFVGGDLLDDALGLDSLGQEVERWGEDIHQVLNVMSGQYHSRAKDAEEVRARVQAAADKYTSDMDALVSKMDRLVAFHEIFKMAAQNRVDRYQDQYLGQLNSLMETYTNMMAALKADFDFVLGLIEGPFIQRIIGSLIMAEGGLMSDIGDMLNGNADSGTWKRVITTIILIIIVVLMWWNPLGWGAAAGLAGMSVLTMSLITLGAFLTVDAMYANGAAMGAVMSVLDFIFNDVLNLDDLIGGDFDKFDKDHDDYAEMTMYTKLFITLATVISSFGASASTSTTGASSLNAASASMTQTTAASASTTGAGSSAINVASAGMTQTTVGTASAVASNMATTIFGIDMSTYSSIYSAYKVASSVNDAVTANKAYEVLKDKLTNEKLALETAISNKYRKNFMKHYKDTAYFLQDQQEFVDRYIWSMTAQSMYVDPYGTTPVANIRFTPDEDTRMLSFGFEDVFDESGQAGSRGYFNSIIYG